MNPAALILDDVRAGLAQGVDAVLQAQPAADPARRARLHRARHDFAFFRRHYLPDWFAAPDAPVHEIVCRDRRQSRFAAHALPRKFGKTTWCEAEVLHRLLFGTLHFAIFMRDDLEAAEAQVEHMRDELEHNKRLLDDFGPLRGERRWRTTDFITSTGVRVLAMGRGQSIRGVKHGIHRPDLIICDDIDETEKMLSDDQREKDKEWFNQDVLLALADEARLWVIGTIEHQDSLLMHAIKKKNFKSRIIAALRDDGTPEWPDKFPLPVLRRIREDIGSIAYSREMLNRPLDPETAPFKRRYLRTWQPPFRNLEIPSRQRTYLGVDLAISLKRTADPSAFVVITFDSAGNSYERAHFQERLSFRRQLAALRSFAATWKPLKIGVSAVGYEAALSQLAVELSNLPVHAVKVHQAKTVRAEPLAANWEAGKCFLRSDDSPLARQLLTFPVGQADHLVEAWMFAHEVAGVQGAGGGAFLGLGNLWPERRR